MEGFEVEVTARQDTGSGAARRARKAGFLPSVVYHAGEASVPVLVSAREFIRLGTSAKKSQVFVLKSNIDKLNGRPAIVKDVQIDYLKKMPLHVDFLALNENEDVEVTLTIKFVGEAPGVKLDGGVLTILKHETQVKCLPKNIPQVISVDISALKIGQSIHIREVALPEGVRFLESPDETIVSVVAQSEHAAAATPAVAAAAAPAADAKAAAPAAAAKTAAKPEAKK